MPKYNSRFRQHGKIVRNSDIDPKEILEILEKTKKMNGHHAEGFNPFKEMFGQKENNVYREDNHIYYRCDVTVEDISELIRLIDECNTEISDIQADCKIGTITPNPIYLHITSYGGDLHAGMMCFDAIRRSKVPIYTIADGYAVSAGSIILMAGAKKMMTPSSYVLIHQLSTGTHGTYENHVDNQANIDKMMEHMKRIYLENTKMKLKEIEKILKRDLYLNATECMKYGIVDEVWTGQDL